MMRSGWLLRTMVSSSPKAHHEAAIADHSDGEAVRAGERGPQSGRKAEADGLEVLGEDEPVSIWHAQVDRWKSLEVSAVPTMMRSSGSIPSRADHECSGVDPLGGRSVVERGRSVLCQASRHVRGPVAEGGSELFVEFHRSPMSGVALSTIRPREQLPTRPESSHRGGLTRGRGRRCRTCRRGCQTPPAGRSRSGTSRG